MAVLGSLKKMETKRELKRLAKYLSVDSSKVTGESNLPCHKPTNGRRIVGVISLAKQLTRGSDKRDLLGTGVHEVALVNQWLEYRLLHVDRFNSEKDLQNSLKELNGYLSERAFLIGNRLTLADILLYFGLHTAFSNMTFYDKEQFLHLSRWFDQVQNITNLRQDLSKIFFQKNLIYSKTYSSH